VTETDAHFWKRMAGDEQALASVAIRRLMVAEGRDVRDVQAWVGLLEELEAEMKAPANS